MGGITGKSGGIATGIMPIYSGLATPGGTKFTLLGGPTVNVERFGPMTGTAIYLTERQDALRFIKEIMPAPYARDDVVNLPRAFVPLAPSGLIPISAAIDSFSDDRPLDPFDLDAGRARPRGSGAQSKGDGTYEDYAKITVEFATTLEGFWQATLTSEEPEKFLERDSNRTVEMLSIHPDKNIKTKASDNADPKQIKTLVAPIVQVIPITETTCTWNWALDPDFDKIEQCLGCVNKDNDKFLDQPERATVLFMGVNAKRQYRWQFYNNAFNPSVLVCYTLEYKFAERAIIQGEGEDQKIFGWNHIYNPDIPGWAEVEKTLDDGSTVPLYPEKSFKEFLFKCVADQNQQTNPANLVAEEEG